MDKERMKVSVLTWPNLANITRYSAPKRLSGDVKRSSTVVVGLQIIV